MNQRYEYETTASSDAVVKYDFEFKEKVSFGWRLVTVVKAGKDYYLTYWERPFSG